MKEYGVTYQEINGTIRRSVPKERMSKKERIKRRWKDREEERFEGQKLTGRGNVAIEQIEKVKDFMRQKGEKGVTAVEVSHFVGVSQSRAARLLDLLSGVCKDKNDDEEKLFDPDKFLVYSDEDVKPPRFYIYKDGGEK